MLVGDRVVVGNARLPRVDVRAAQLLGRDLLARGRLHERWAADEDRARALDDDRLVAHRRDVGAARGARAHDRSDLGDARSGEARLVVEDSPEVVAVGEDLGLEREERAARVDEVDARQAVLLGDFLRPQVLLHRQREVRAALDRGVVRDDHALAALDDADPGDDPGRRRLASYTPQAASADSSRNAVSGSHKPVDPLARRELAARAMALERLLSASLGDGCRALAKLGDELLHALPPPREGIRVAFHRCGEHCHRPAA